MDITIEDVQRWVVTISLLVLAVCYGRRELRIIKEMSEAYDSKRDCR